jgi:hypothetical protein
MGFFLLFFSFLLCLASSVCTQDYLTKIDPRSAEFLQCMAFFEGRILGAAFWPDVGMTKDGCFVDGSNVVSCHEFSAPSKESLHLGVLAHAVYGRGEARLFVLAPTCMANNTPMLECFALALQTGEGVALTMLEKKMSAIEQFNEDFPGFGGYLPWFKVSCSLDVLVGGFLRAHFQFLSRSTGLDELFRKTAGSIKCLRLTTGK